MTKYVLWKLKALTEFDKVWRNHGMTKHVLRKLKAPSTKFDIKNLKVIMGHKIVLWKSNSGEVRRNWIFNKFFEVFLIKAFMSISVFYKSSSRWELNSFVHFSIQTTIPKPLLGSLHFISYRKLTSHWFQRWER